MKKEITTQINRLSLEDPAKLEEYLKELYGAQEISAADILGYTTYQWNRKPGKPYVIPDTVLNQLGIFVGQSNKEDKDLAFQFYQKAAVRGDKNAQMNFAIVLFCGKYGQAKNIEQALEYSTAAIKAGHSNSLLHAKILRANQQNSAAIPVLVAALNAATAEASKAKSTEQASAQKAIEQSSDLLKISLQEMLDQLDQHNEDALRLMLQSIQQILKCQHTRIQLETYFLQGMVHQRLTEYQKAMAAYLKISDKQHPRYTEGMKCRAQLFKAVLEEEILQLPKGMDVDEADGSTVSNQSDNSSSAACEAEETENVITLPGKLSFPLYFGKAWHKIAPWFDSVNGEKLAAEHQKWDSYIELQKKAKHQQLELTKALLTSEQDAGNADLPLSVELKKQKKLLDTQLAQLEAQEQKVNAGYTKHRMDSRKTRRRHLTEQRFFDPARSKKQTELAELGNQLIEHRFNDAQAPIASIDLTRFSARRLITAETAFQQAAKKLAQKTDYTNLDIGLPKAAQGKYAKGVIETYQVNDTIIKAQHLTETSQDRLGNSYLPQHGTYQQIYQFLIKLSQQQPESEKQLADYMIRFGQNHKSITLPELQALYPGAQAADVDQFNQICFLLLSKEQAQWMSAVEERYQLGMSVAQARCLLMIQAGYLSFEDAFITKAMFGVYSQVGILKAPQYVADACQKIENLYQEFLKAQHPQDFLPFFKKFSSEDMVLTREQAHKDLKAVYGGDTDTDGDDYLSDTSFNA